MSALLETDVRCVVGDESWGGWSRNIAGYLRRVQPNLSRLNGHD